MSVVPAQSTSYFFWSLLRDHVVGLTPDATAYVTAVLTGFSRSDEVYAGVGFGEKPVLVDFLSRARDADPAERTRIYRHVGDLSLFTAGLFAASLAVSRSYYVAVGAGSYGSAAALERSNAAPVFEELADRFEDVADALAETLT